MVIGQIDFILTDLVVRIVNGFRYGGGGGTNPTPSEGWGRGGTPRRPNSRATPQGLDHRLRIEREEPKDRFAKGSEAGQSRRR